MTGARCLRAASEVFDAVEGTAATILLCTPYKAKDWSIKHGMYFCTSTPYPVQGLAKDSTRRTKAFSQFV